MKLLQIVKIGIIVGLFLLLSCIGKFPNNSNFTFAKKLNKAQNIKTTEKILKYYEATYGKCQHEIIIEYLNVESFDCGGITATGCTIMYKNDIFSSEIYIAVKNRPTCDIIITLIHELRHACHGLNDCYSFNCWSYRLDKRKRSVCRDMLTNY